MLCFPRAPAGDVRTACTMLWQETSAFAIRKSPWLLACLLLVTSACDSSPPREPATLGDRQTVAPTTTAASTEKPVVPADAPTVVFLGDSISAGLHLPEAQAFPALLQRALQAGGHPFKLINAGVSGDTSAGGLRRLPWLLKQSPDIVVVELGANDGLRGLPPKSTQENLRAILAQIREHGARALLLGMRIPPSYGEPYASEFAGIYPALAAETGVAFVPFFMEGVAGVTELNLPDGIHPTSAGHVRLAERLTPPLAALVQELARRSP